MGNPDTACIAFKISQAPYRPLFELVWGADFDIKWPGNAAEICGTPNGAARFGGSATPIALSSDDRTKANNIYDTGGSRSRSSKVQKISVPSRPNSTPSWLGRTLSQQTRWPGTTSSTAKPTAIPAISMDWPPARRGYSGGYGALFTCFGYSNLGLPLNPRVSIFYESTPDRFGFTPNPDGFRFRNLGFGTFLRSGPGSGPNPNAVNWLQFAPATDGQMQTSTARNVAMTPPQCPTTEAGQMGPNGPIPYFQKEFFHNGYAKSLKQLVHFYDTRDAFPLPTPVTSGHCPAGTTEKVDCWPQPEVPDNVDMTVGNLGLTDQEENQVVAFLQTLSDGFTTPY